MSEDDPVMRQRMAKQELFYKVMSEVFGPTVNHTFTPDVTGLEHIPAEGPALLIGNHRSMLDPVVLGSVIDRPINFIAASFLFRLPLLSQIVEHAGAVPLSVKGGGKSQRQLEQASELLRDGRLVCIYPEGLRGFMAIGTETAGEIISNFHSGFVRLVIEAGIPGLPVIPIALAGLDERLITEIPPQLFKLLESSDKLEKSPVRLTAYSKAAIRIGKPRTLDAHYGRELDKAEVQALCETFRQDVIALYEEAVGRPEGEASYAVPRVLEEAPAQESPITPTTYLGLNVRPEQLAEDLAHLIDADETLLGVFDGVACNALGRRLGGLTLQDYLLLTDRRLLVWRRGLLKERVESYRLDEIDSVTGRHFLAHGSVEWTSRDRSVRLFSRLPLRDVYKATTLILRASGIEDEPVESYEIHAPHRPEIAFELTEQLDRNGEESVEVSVPSERIEQGPLLPFLLTHLPPDQARRFYMLMRLVDLIESIGRTAQRSAFRFLRLAPSMALEATELARELGLIDDEEQLFKPDETPNAFDALITLTRLLRLATAAESR